MMWVAVDGGQSALRLRWPGGQGDGPGHRHGPDAVPAMLEAMRCAARAAGLLRGDHPVTPIGVACLGLTGYPEAQSDVTLLADGAARLLGATEVRVCEDMVTAHAGALPEGYGVVVAAGTGVVSLAVDDDGAWRKVDGGGFLFGDAGGAFAIGRAGLEAVQRAKDGRGPATKLTDALPDARPLYRSVSLVDDVARLAPHVIGCAEAGDEVAAGIVHAAARELAHTVATAVASLRPRDTVPVAYTGRLFSAGPVLLDPLRAHLSRNASLRPAAGTPLDGAQRLATGALGTYAGLVAAHRFSR